ncbi:hypothetical protein [Candidatus Thioglobus autotrophicus]|nr:hypothetical protein [Candidatus Thioglobus autotrophicus]WPE17506.1 hypothetical protein R5P05_05405 [Candidatus Thioglobus autotrophicus]
MKKIAVLFILLLSSVTFAHVAGETIAPLPLPVDSQSEAQKQIVRDGAQNFCDGAEEDAKEECVMDFFANHNLEEEPSCD